MNLSGNVKIRALTLLLMILTFNFIAQDAFKNHQKYWYYKSRLKNDFMKVGLKQGESIPFAQRGFRTKVDYDNPSIINYSSKMNGADLISELGIYLGVLATEYKLLRLNNQNTDSVDYELYCALNAINRVDYNAEPMYGNYSKSLDGFFVRDDIPRQFVRNNYQHFNYYNSWDGTSVLPTPLVPSDQSLDTLHIPNTGIARKKWNI